MRSGEAVYDFAAMERWVVEHCVAGRAVLRTEGWGTFAFHSETFRDALGGGRRHTRREAADESQEVAEVTGFLGSEADSMRSKDCPKECLVQAVGPFTPKVPRL